MNQDIHTPHAVVAEGLGKRYGDQWALRDFDLAVPTGSVLGLLGHNGAGKTTAIRILTTLAAPTAGSAKVAGHDVVTEPTAVRDQIGLTSQAATVDGLMSGFANLEMIGRLYHLPRKVAQARATELLAELQLEDAGDRLVKEYSGGMRRRLDLAAALIGRPRLLFLDEPTTGLDPRGRMNMWEVIRGLVAGGTTLLLTTQYLEEADALADRIAVVDSGRIIAGGTSDELKAQVGGERIEVVVHDPAQIDRAVELLRRHSIGAPEVDQHVRRITAPTDGGAATLTDVLRELDAQSIRLDDIALRRPTLDDVFLSLTGHRAEAATTTDEEDAA
jgi:ABC-2 type transport system ATP-binding protein